MRVCMYVCECGCDKCGVFECEIQRECVCVYVCVYVCVRVLARVCVCVCVCSLCTNTRVRAGCVAVINILPCPSPATEVFVAKRNFLDCTKETDKDTDSNLCWSNSLTRMHVDRAYMSRPCLYNSNFYYI